MALWLSLGSAIPPVSLAGQLHPRAPTSLGFVSILHHQSWAVPRGMDARSLPRAPCVWDLPSPSLLASSLGLQALLCLRVNTPILGLDAVGDGVRAGQCQVLLAAPTARELGPFPALARSAPSQVPFSNLLPLTQIPNNMQIKNNNKKKAQLPKQSALLHTSAPLRTTQGSGQHVAGARPALGTLQEGRGSTQGLVPSHHWGREAKEAPCAPSLLCHSAKGAIRGDEGELCSAGHSLQATKEPQQGSASRVCPEGMVCHRKHRPAPPLCFGTDAGQRRVSRSAVVWDIVSSGATLSGHNLGRTRGNACGPRGHPAGLAENTKLLQCLGHPALPEHQHGEELSHHPEQGHFPPASRLSGNVASREEAQRHALSVISERRSGTKPEVCALQVPK